MLALLAASAPGLAPAPRVVFTDCDGTMLQPDHTLSSAASTMLHTLSERGVRVVPATGRARAGPWIESVLNAHPVLQRGNPGVYLNGCCAFNEEGEALASTYLPAAAVERIFDWWATSADAAGCGLVAYVGGEALFMPGQRKEREAELMHEMTLLGDSPPTAVSDVPADAVFKLILHCGDDERVQTVRPLLPSLLAGDGQTHAGLTQAIPGYLEVVPSAASKATACAALLERWGLRWEEALAIGDGSNDLPMLRAAGTSVAMGNGPDVVKAAAQHVVGTNAEEGWVEAMEKYVLDRL